MRTAIRAAVIAVFVLGLPSLAAADVPQLVNYQGILLDSNGDPVVSPRDVVFTIYDDSTGGNPKWSETRTVTPDANGLFNILLGASTPIDDSVFSGPNRWLGIAVGGDPEMTPRCRLVCSPFAYRVSTVDGATGGIISGDVSIQSDLDLNGDLRVTGKATIGPGHTNMGTDAFVAGKDNTVYAPYVTVSGGYDNAANVDFCVVGGGYSNVANGYGATVGGGKSDTANGYYATIGGGELNTANGEHSTIGGGSSNRTTDVVATISGGNANTAGASASVGGGGQNSADGMYATIPGGYHNSAMGEYSFAAGQRAKALDRGTFVWADDVPYDFPSIAIREFAARATGGVRFVTSVDGSGDPDAGVRVASGGGSWSSISDRNLKENFSPVDVEAILAKLVAMPITTWNYKAQEESIRHIGPTAQDMYAAFGVGEDDRHITTIDGHGIALAAIQGLYQQNQEQQKEIAELRALVNQLLAERQ